MQATRLADDQQKSPKENNEQASADNNAAEAPKPQATEPAVIGGAYLYCASDVSSISCTLVDSKGKAASMQGTVQEDWQLINSDGTITLPAVTSKDMGGGVKLFNLDLSGLTSGIIKLLVKTEDEQSLSYSFDVANMQPLTPAANPPDAGGFPPGGGGGGGGGLPGPGGGPGSGAVTGSGSSTSSSSNPSSDQSIIDKLLATAKKTIDAVLPK